MNAVKIRQVAATLLLLIAVTFAWKVWDVGESLRVEFDPVTIANRSQSRREQIAKVESAQAMDALIESDEVAVERALASRGASIRAGQRKHVEWAATKTFQTELSIIYIHGFSASLLEVEPVVSDLAKRLGANLFFTRLHAHGLSDGEDFGKVRAQDWAVDVEEAMAIGHRIGRGVIVIAMSTGAALAIENQERSARVPKPVGASPPKTRAMILLSPNYDPTAFGTFLLAGRWGATLARAIVGPYNEFKIENPMHGERWTSRYRSEGLAAMMTAVERTRKLDLSKIATPVLTIYSKQDDVVDIGAIEARSREFPPPSKLVAWSVARRHELVSKTFDAEHVPELEDLIQNWLQELEIGPRINK